MNFDFIFECLHKCHLVLEVFYYFSFYVIMSFFFLLSFYLPVFILSGFVCPLLLLLLFVVTVLMECGWGTQISYWRPFILNSLHVSNPWVWLPRGLCGQGKDKLSHFLILWHGANGKSLPRSARPSITLCKCIWVQERFLLVAVQSGGGHKHRIPQLWHSHILVLHLECSTPFLRLILFFWIVWRSWFLWLIVEHPCKGIPPSQSCVSDCQRNKVSKPSSASWHCLTTHCHYLGESLGFPLTQFLTPHLTPAVSIFLNRVC